MNKVNIAGISCVVLLSFVFIAWIGIPLLTLHHHEDETNRILQRIDGGAQLTTSDLKFFENCETDSLDQTKENILLALRSAKGGLVLRSTQIVRHYLSDDDPDTRLLALSVFNELLPADRLDVLHRMQLDPDKKVRHAAKDILAKGNKSYFW